MTEKKKKKNPRVQDEKTRKVRRTIRGIKTTPRGRSLARLRVRLSRSSLGGPLTFPRKLARNRGETIPSVGQSEISAVGPFGDESKAKTKSRRKHRANEERDEEEEKEEEEVTRR